MMYVQMPRCPAKSDINFRLFSVCSLSFKIFLGDFTLMVCLPKLLTAVSVISQLLSRFLYSDEVQIGPETVMTTLYTAKKYAVPALEAHCVEFLTKHLRADNAFMLLTQVSKCS